VSLAAGDLSNITVTETLTFLDCKGFKDISSFSAICTIFCRTVTGRDPFPAADLRSLLFPAHPVQHNSDLFLSAVGPAVLLLAQR
jgi:hypothetical protein